MEDLSVTVRTGSAPVAASVKTTVPTPTLSKSHGVVPKNIHVSEEDKTSLGHSEKFPQDVTAGAVKEAVENLNSQLESSARSIRFQIDDTTDKIEVYVIDKETGEVVRRIPPEASIRLSANGELSGLFTIQG